jgi:hypothetical protein
MLPSMPDDPAPDDKLPPHVVPPQSATVSGIIMTNEEQRRDAARKLAERHNAALRRSSASGAWSHR